MKVYFDNAATSQIDPEVIQDMLPVLTQYYGNPSSVHNHGREVRAIIEKSRKKIAGMLNTSPAEIFFTSGGTESDNLAILSSISSLKIKTAITSKIEHPAVLNPLRSLEEQGTIALYYVDNDEKGNLNLEHLAELLQAHPVSLVSLMHANNEIGTINNLQAISSLVRKSGGIFHSDTVQTMGHLTHDLQTLDIDFIVGSAHKFHGPKGIGFVYINSKNKIAPLIQGGGQERNMRGGTENVYGIVGIAKALELAYQNLDQNEEHIRGIKSAMIYELKNSFSDLRFNGMSEDIDNSLPTVLNVSFPKNDKSEMLLFHLDINHISASSGSACSSGSNISSPILKAINCPEDRVSVRFSFSRYNTIDEVKFAISKLEEILHPALILK